MLTSFLRSQVELNTAIICASAPSLQPLIKRAFHRLSSSRGAYYYYGGGQYLTTLPPSPEATETRYTRRDSVSEVRLPAAVYVPKATIQTKVTPTGLTEEEEMIRARVRAFSNPSSPINTGPISPAQPAFITR